VEGAERARAKMEEDETEAKPPRKQRLFPVRRRNIRDVLFSPVLVRVRCKSFIRRNSL